MQIICSSGTRITIRVKTAISPVHYIKRQVRIIHTITQLRSRFGIALKNVGPAMRFSGDGLAVQGLLVAGDHTLTLEQRSAQLELPSMMNIGAAYDFNISELHRFTLAGTFISNSFTKDQFVLGAEYAFKNMR